MAGTEFGLVPAPHALDINKQLLNYLDVNFKRIQEVFNATITTIVSGSGGGGGAGTGNPVGSGPAMVPVGGTLPFWGSVAPTGWLMCEGQSLVVADYTALFAAIGYTYGGAGANFNLPNATGRVLVCRSAADADWDALGEIRGAKSVTLAEANLPSHDHSVQAGTNTDWVTQPDTVIEGAHSHGFGIQTEATAGAHHHAAGIARVAEAPSAGVLGFALNFATDNGNLGNTDWDHYHGLASVGSGTAHDNIQPSIVINYIIKV